MVSNHIIMRRRQYLKTTSLGVTLFGLAGCLGEPPDSSSDNESNNSGNNSGNSSNASGNRSGSDSSGGPNLAIISGVGGFGDKAFNDLALQGLQRAVKEFGGQINQIDGEGGQFQSLQSQAAQASPSYDLIVCVSANQADALQANAAEFGDQKWMLINQGLFRDNGEHFENVAGYVWANHEMSFQAGVAAATMTTREFSHQNSQTTPDSPTVGFVGGVDSALINAFERAYIAGVEHIDDGIDVRAGYAGSFEDPAAGKEVALSQYNAGADIVYHAAAATGPGIFQAAQEQNRFAIGVDADQSKTLSEYSAVIMGSAVKRIGVGTYEVARAVNNGNWGNVGGQEHILGLAEDAVAFVPGVDIGEQLPNVVEENLQQSKDGIINGDITVPCEASGC